MRIDYDQFVNGALEECNLQGLYGNKIFGDALAFTTSSPTPTGAVSGRQDWIPVSAATNGNEGAMPMPPPGAT